MYWGAGLALGGAALFFRSLGLVAYVLVLGAAVGAFVRWYEEPTLRRLFGAEYEAYCRTVPRWWPVRSRDRKAGA
jgi:protein-S-isoprenylcysteine O-methyltransferase Ste14